jgi:hypothetical protein
VILLHSHPEKPRASKALALYMEKTSDANPKGATI